MEKTFEHKTLDTPWANFDKPEKKVYEPVTRPGWPDLPIWAGDIDSVDYKVGK